jgi:hypothetical protein
VGLTKVVDLSQTTADKMLPVMVANKTFLRPYRSDTTVSPIMKVRLTGTQRRTNETLAETKQTPHSSTKQDDIPILSPHSHIIAPADQ